MPPSARVEGADAFMAWVAAGLVSRRGALRTKSQVYLSFLCEFLRFQLNVIWMGCFELTAAMQYLSHTL